MDKEKGRCYKPTGKESRAGEGEEETGRPDT
jgi:hypothetical protein